MRAKHAGTLHKYLALGALLAGTGTHGACAPQADKGQILNVFNNFYTWNGGHGRVVSEPTGIDCGEQCSATFPTDAGVKLTATAEPGFRFVKWLGACDHRDAECLIKMDTTQQVDASFEREVPDPPFRCPEGTQDNDGDKVCAPSCATAGLSCSADGPCSDSSGTATCTCPPEWSGPSCTQCAPASGQAIYLFTVANSTNGNLGGRSGADAKARAALPTNLPGMPNATYRVRAFLSMTDDAIADFPKNYCVPTGVPVYGVKSDGTLTLLADTWADFTDGTIKKSIGAALGYADYLYFWTGTTNTAAASQFNCSNWTSDSRGVLGGTSQRSSSTNKWLYEDAYACSSQYYLHALAYCVKDCPQ